MIQIGQTNRLKIVNFTVTGAYLGVAPGNKKDIVMLPGNQLPPDAKEGDILDVFIYRDSENRLIATTQQPFAQIGELGYLEVTAKTEIGAFLDFGLERGLFLPFVEQKYPLEIGKSYLVYLYLDKSQRLCCTTDIYEYLTSNAPYQKNDKVTGTVYQVNREIGVFVAVDNKYMGLIPINENFQVIKPGDSVEARVIRVREDGKLDLSSRELSHLQMDIDSDTLLEYMEDNQGCLPLNEQATPKEIEIAFKMSKAAFKRAIGRLLKNKKIVKTENGFRLVI